MPTPVSKSFEISIEDGSKIVVDLRWSLPHGEIRQRVLLHSWTPRIDFETKVDWYERDTLLKVAFPVTISARQAAFEIQFGHIYRPTTRNTSWEAAQFEVCAQRWMDVSESGYGVALMSDCKHGYDVVDNVPRFTCLRGTSSPDATADVGHHEFTTHCFRMSEACKMPV